MVNMPLYSLKVLAWQAPKFNWPGLMPSQSQQHKLPCGTKGATNCGSREGHTEWPIDMHTI